MDRSEPDKRLGEMTVELEELSAICRDEEDPTANINLAVSIIMIWKTHVLLVHVLVCVCVVCVVCV